MPISKSSASTCHTLPGAPSRCVTSDDRHTFETFASFFWAGGWCRCLGKLNAGSAKSGYILRYVCASGTVTGCGSRWRVLACIQFLQVSITSWQHPSSAVRKCKYVEALSAAHQISPGPKCRHHGREAATQTTPASRWDGTPKLADRRLDCDRYAFLNGVLLRRWSITVFSFDSTRIAPQACSAPHPTKGLCLTLRGGARAPTQGLNCAKALTTRSRTSERILLAQIIVIGFAHSARLLFAFP